MVCSACGHKYIRAVNSKENDTPVIRNNLPVSTGGRFRLNKIPTKLQKQEDLSDTVQAELKSSIP